MNNYIENTKQLVEYIMSGIKAVDNCKIGIEFESFLYHKSNLKNLTYEEQNGILEVLKQFKVNNPEWENIFDNQYIIGLHHKTLGNISLEPAGQFELSSNSYTDVHQIKHAVEQYLRELVPILNNLDVGIFHLGFNPKFLPNELPMMPKSRYSDIMYKYMPKVGTLGQYMMKGTATLQANLDFTSEVDLAKKFRVSMALHPFIVALFAHSPISNGVSNGYLSFRGHIWQHTDNARVGFLDFVLSDSFDVIDYVNYALDVPMYFLKRGDTYLDVSGLSFRDFMVGKSPYFEQKFEKIFEKKFKKEFKREKATIKDFVNHLGTLFPYVRLKNYLEIRGADCPDFNFINTLPALFIGLLYDNAALENIYNLIKSFTKNELVILEHQVNKTAFQGIFRNTKLSFWLREILDIAQSGLKSRKLGEERYLEPLYELLYTNRSLAEHKLVLFQSLNNNIDSFIKKITFNQ